MVLHAEPSDRAAAAAEFRATLGALGLTPRHAARIFAVGSRSIRRWQDGARGVPRAVTLVCRLMTVGAVTIEQVEEVAVPVPARANGGAKGEPPAPLHAEPASDQSTLARAEAAALADSSSTTAEKVLALVEGTCRWPSGDPRDRDFRFCGAPVVAAPYCAHHRTLAYLAPRPSRGHGFHIGFVAHGRLPAPVHDRPSTPGAFSAAGVARVPTSQAAFPSNAQPPA
jgi:hypothetical protein